MNCIMRAVTTLPLVMVMLGGSAVAAVGAPVADGVPLPAVAKAPKVGLAAEVPAPARQVVVGAVSWAKVERESKTSLRVWWARVPGASGYVVYRWDSKKKRYASVKTLTKASATSWVDNKRKTGKKYSYKVAAYRIVGGKKKVGPQSYWVSAVPYKKNAKVVNAGTLTSRSRNIGLMAPANLFVPGGDLEHCPRVQGACVIPSKASKAKNKRVVDTTVRLMVVSGKNVVRTTSDGGV